MTARMMTRQEFIEQAQDRLAGATEYAALMRGSVDPEQDEACERAIRFANMWSQAILAMSVDPSVVGETRQR